MIYCTENIIFAVFFFFQLERFLVDQERSDMLQDVKV